MHAKQPRQLRLALGAACLLMGSGFSVAQALVAREFVVSFSGNELTIGLLLGSWLLLEAAGSGLLGRLLRGTGPGPLALLQVLFALLLPATLWAVYGVRHLLGAVPGVGLGLEAVAAAAFLLLVPLGLVDGMMFAAACRAGQMLPGAVYVAEALGGVAGGLVFTYLLIPHLQPLAMGLLLGAANLSCALSLLCLSPPPVKRRWPRLALLALLGACLALLLTPAAGRLQRGLLAWRWRGHELVFSQDSVYGNVAAIHRHGQLTLFASGLPVLTTPVPDIALVEEMVHLGALFVPAPRRALVLGGGLGGPLRELLKYPLERVDYAELDPLLIQAASRLDGPLTAAELGDRRVHVEPVDGRLFLQRLVAAGVDRYDLVLVNLPYPTTLQINRLYTADCWRLVRGLLHEQGVVVVPAPGSLTYLSPGMRDLNSALWASLAEAFPHQRPIPGDVTLWLASPSDQVETADVATLLLRWRARALPSDLVSEFHVRLKLDQGRLAWFRACLTSGAPVPANRDLHPSALLHGLACWSELFSPALLPYLRLLGRLRLPMLLLPLGALALAALPLVQRGRWPAAPILAAIATTGFAGMAADLIIIFAFQALCGYVYQRIGLLLASFMAGLSLGGWLAVRAQCGGSSRQARPLLRLEATLVGFWLGLPTLLTLLRGAPGQLLQPLFLGLNALAGLLVGAEFPLANRLYPRPRPDPGATASLLYAADLAGASVAAVLVSTALLPALGAIQTCLLVAALKAASLALLGASAARP